jgi:hypothetical protein
MAAPAGRKIADGLASASSRFGTDVGHQIFVYQKIDTKQTVYSLTRSMRVSLLIKARVYFLTRTRIEPHFNSSPLLARNLFHQHYERTFGLRFAYYPSQTQYKADPRTNSSLNSNTSTKSHGLPKLCRTPKGPMAPLYRRKSRPSGSKIKKQTQLPIWHTFWLCRSARQLNKS